MKKEDQLQEYIQKALENIDLDRAKADHLLKDIMNEMMKRKGEYKDLGPVAAKYLESLTRCNEQLVRIVGLLNPKQKSIEEKLSVDDKDVLYDVFQKEQNEKNDSNKKEKS